MWSARRLESVFVLSFAVAAWGCSKDGSGPPPDSTTHDTEVVAADSSSPDMYQDLFGADKQTPDGGKDQDNSPADSTHDLDAAVDQVSLPDLPPQEVVPSDAALDSDTSTAPDSENDIAHDVPETLSDLASSDDISQDTDVLDVEQEDEYQQQDAEQEVVVPPLCPAPQDWEGNVLSGTVYLDGDGSSDSLYQQSIGLADSAFAGATVEVLLPGQEWQQRTSCPDGAFAFGGLPEGRGICRLVLDAPYWPSTANAPKRFPEALAEGEITILTFGDSIPSFGAQPYFPDRLADMLAPFALVHNINVAVPGTATGDWLPTTNRFKNTLLPLLPEADVIVVSLGGNDMNYWVGYDNLTFEEALQLAAEFPQVMEEVRDNLDIILAAVAEANPSADIVYFIYPNYAVSTYWKNLAPDYIALIGNALKNELGKVRKHFSRPGITLVDMLGATPLIDLDACLSDPLHLSEAGTHVWARQLFLALGGFELSPDPLGVTRSYGVALQQ